jgi:exodeoxyribonuclease-3
VLRGSLRQLLCETVPVHAITDIPPKPSTTFVGHDVQARAAYAQKGSSANFTDARPTSCFDGIAQSMRIATWNVNSIKQRVDHLRAWISERSPDIVCLQETKCVDEAFPREPFDALGYNVAVHGQKAFNGVAVLSKYRFDEVMPRLPGEEGDDHARFIEVVLSTHAGAIRVASLYLPNGNPPGSDKYAYKIAWMERLIRYASDRLRYEEPLVLAGDFNVIPTSSDARHPDRWVGDALFQPLTRTKFRALCNLGLVDAVRAGSDGPGPYTFWDYQAGAWQKNDGIRIDHLLLSPQGADRLLRAGVDQQLRGWEKPSDHVPVWIDLELEAVPSLQPAPRTTLL